MGSTTIRLEIELDQAHADLLADVSARCFVDEQPDRFEAIGGGHLPAWKGATMQWCSTPASALMLRAFEEQSGFDALLGWDLAASGTDWTLGYVVLSRRPWPHG
jgi:hypothetical protein